ncbi:MAG: hypothetical protein GC138_00930 [Gammaproteobacteria bacterium]|nr:hypothetical protein [Gammaproteobacteria bacterium]
MKAHWFGIFLLSLFLGGCATYGRHVHDGLDAFAAKDYDSALESMDKTLGDDSDDRLLRHMELGLINHLAGHYERSAQDLAKADEIAEDLYTHRLKDVLATMLVNPRNGPYRGTDFERAYIPYYEIMNALAQSARPEQWSDALTAARVASRKSDILLTAQRNKVGDYQDLKDEKRRLFSQLMDIFSVVLGTPPSRAQYVFRDDAYIRYVTGLVYELNGEYDNARIAYEQAAHLYEDGYAKQYGLNGDIVREAWFETARMMKKAGGYDGELAHVVKTKLSAEQGEALKATANGGQLLIIQHIGMVPRRREMNLIGSVDERKRELVLRLLPMGTIEERRDQAAWFYQMYADKGLLEFLENYAEGGLLKVFWNTREKEVPLQPVWHLAQNSGLVAALRQGIRVTVPYYPSFRPAYQSSVVRVDGGTPLDMIDAESLSRLAIQSQIVSACTDMNEALSREALKSVLTLNALKGNKQEASPLAGLAASLVSMVTSAAETRNWLTLPSDIRIRRIPLTNGTHEVTIETNRTGGGSYDLTRKQVTIESGETQVLEVRSLPGLPRK